MSIKRWMGEARWLNRNSTVRNCWKEWKANHWPLQTEVSRFSHLGLTGWLGVGDMESEDSRGDVMAHLGNTWSKGNSPQPKRGGEVCATCRETTLFPLICPWIRKFLPVAHITTRVLGPRTELQIHRGRGWELPKSMMLPGGGQSLAAACCWVIAPSEGEAASLARFPPLVPGN